jgi:HlyD family secretion protein
VDIKRDPPKKTKLYILSGLGIIALVAATVGIANLDTAVPSIERTSLWVDTVKKGDMVRAVSAAGNLVPEHVRIVSAVTQGRVEAIPLRPGAIVTPTTILVELSNPDLVLDILDFDKQLAANEQANASTKSQFRSQIRNMETSILNAEISLKDAKRAVAENDAVARVGNYVSKADVETAKDNLAKAERSLSALREDYAELKVRQVEETKLSEETLTRTRAMLEEKRRRALTLRVPAGEAGVLKSMNLELGQYVNSGAEIARIVRPDMLKATLRVPDSQAKDVALGQFATIDLHNGTILKGHVSRIDPTAVGGTVNIDIQIEDKIPAGARADQSIDGTIEIEKLKQVLYVARPANTQAEGTGSVFVLSEDGKSASRRQVKLGRSSVTTVQVLEGLAAGDRVLIIDMSPYESSDKVKIKG